MAWFQEWFGEEYLELYAHRDAGEAARHVQFVRALFPETPRAVLDLACGAGRHTEALRRAGLRALGVDLSLTLLAQSPHLPRVAGDMRLLPFADATFDWVLNFFTSFGYFEEERQNFRVLEEILRILSPGGRFLLDLMNVEHALAHLEPSEETTLRGQRVEIRRWWDPAHRRINKRIRLTAPGHPARTFRESVRGYAPDEVEIGLRWAGLEVTGIYGGFAGEAYGPDSPRMILAGRRPG